MVAEPSNGISEALASLGPPVAIDVVGGLGACIDRCREVPVDLVVVDEALARDAEEIVARLRCTGPPTILVQRLVNDAAALAWFRRGAVECVVAERDYVALRQAVREQLERPARESAPADTNRPDRIIQHLNSALLVVDTDGRITFANPPAEQILGEPHEALHGRTVWEWFGDGSPDERLLFRSLERGERFRGAETRVVRSGGQIVPVGISCAPIVDAEARITGAVAVFQDLSEAQEWRAHVLQTEKMASIGQLAAGVAHEINNPMGFIHANLFQMAEYVGDLRQVWNRVEALQKAMAGDDRALQRSASEELAEAADGVDIAFVLQDLAKAIRESQEGSERIRHIVQDLRDFSHQDTGERVLADLNQCLDSTANIVWPMMKHLVVLEKDYRELPSVPCYPMQLKQVFMNLLVNAYQAIEDAVGTTGETGTVRLVTAPEDDGVCIEVRDDGAGIAPENLDRIFDPFFTTKQAGAGTGLGLSTSFNIVRRHGGTITVESREGSGTTFRMRLPLLRESIGGGETE